MSWLKYARYLGYLSYVGQIIGAVTKYGSHRDASQLAVEVSEVIYNAIDYATGGKASKRVNRSVAMVAVKNVTDLYKDIID